MPIWAADRPLPLEGITHELQRRNHSRAKTPSWPIVMAGGREREVQQIERANRAAAVGRLLLGEIHSWREFIEAGHLPPDLPRRNIKAGARDVRRNVSKRINSWVKRNFLNADADRLGELFEAIKDHRGLEIPLREFEARFFKVRNEVLRGTPSHATVVISLWGLAFMFPEDFLTKDIITALNVATNSEQELQPYKRAIHNRIAQERESIGALLRQKGHAQRSGVHACFSLLEAYLNGLAWAAVDGHLELSCPQEDMAYLEHCTEKSLRSRLINIPRILTGEQLWGESDERVTGIIEILKPYRDSLTHPSPFRVPEKFGGYDKLSTFYRVDLDTAILAVQLISEAVRAIHRHVWGEAKPDPSWLTDLKKAIERARAKTEETA